MDPYRKQKPYMDSYPPQYQHPVPPQQQPSAPGVAPSAAGAVPFQQQSQQLQQHSYQQLTYQQYQFQQPPPYQSHQAYVPPPAAQQIVEPVHSKQFSLGQSFHNINLPIHAVDWSRVVHGGDDAGKVAIGTFDRTGNNKIMIYQARLGGGLEAHAVPHVALNPIVETPHFPQPVTKIMWGTDSNRNRLISTGAEIQLLELVGDARKPSLEKVSNIKESSTKSRPPITGADWNKLSPEYLLTASVDTTCTVWHLEKFKEFKVDTQLIAHDLDVYDVRYCVNNSDCFFTSGKDGNVRSFDLRDLKSSTIIYEPAQPTKPSDSTYTDPPYIPRIAPSPFYTSYVCAIASDSNDIILLDSRNPGPIVARLQGHTEPVTDIMWSPDHSDMLASCGEDGRILLWRIRSPQHGAVPSVISPEYIQNLPDRPSHLSWSGKSGYKSFVGVTTDAGNFYSVSTQHV